ncbi:precursor protein [Rutstroemia sp. NJR-2017a BVV2]|nr:precursor protein [Rutstroemia sp. NJR-2017a BVV2]PQE09402.1 precursor protein [Rutstroemia sp. NJR-2017a BVV2]
MAYLLYTTVFMFLVFSTVLILTRAQWTPLLPPSLQNLTTHLPTFPSLPTFRYQPVPSTFQTDIESGLHSANFSLADNFLSSTETRSGLSDNGKKEIQKIMRKKKVNFDEARRLWMQETFKREGISEDGLPRDPKFVSFS